MSDVNESLEYFFILKRESGDPHEEYSIKKQFPHPPKVGESMFGGTVVLIFSKESSSFLSEMYKRNYGKELKALIVEILDK